MWRWFRGLPVWAQVVGWIFLFWIVAFFAIWNLRWPAWARVVTMGVLALVLITAIASGTGGSSGKSASGGTTPASSSGTSTSSTTATDTSNPTPAPQRGNPDQVKSIAEDGGQFTYRSSDCTGRTCTVNVKIGQTLFGSEHEVVEPMFPVFKGLFGIKTYRLVTINAYGDVTTIGGKNKVAKLVTVGCTRQANRQIDWDNIDMDGIHALCNEFQFIKFNT